MPRTPKKLPGIEEGTYRDGTRWWRAVADVGVSIDGKRLQRRKTFSARNGQTRQDAIDWRDRQRLERRAGTMLHGGATTLAELVAEWWPIATARLAGGTVSTYRSGLERHILPALGATRLEAITARGLQRHVDALLAAGRSRASVGHAVQALRRVLDQAVAWDMIARNPARHVVLPPYERIHDKRALTVEELARLLVAADADPEHGCLIRLLATTGLRISEALALTWSDVDLTSGVLRVTAHAALDAGRAWVRIGGSKTDAGSRALLLPPSTLASLKLHQGAQAVRRAQAGEAWTPDDIGIIFDTGDGSMRDRQTLRHALARLCRAAGVPVITPHELRHTHSTHAALFDAELKILGRRLGHAAVETTLGYVHTSPDEQRFIVERLEQALAQATRRLTTRPASPAQVTPL